MALAALEEAQSGLAAAVRALADATVRTRVAAPELAAVAEQVETLTARLLAEAREGPLGLETDSAGRLRDHGNAMVGMRNPIAPPLVVTGDESGSTSCALTLGAGYEGPPGYVHGGIVAAVLDRGPRLGPGALGAAGHDRLPQHDLPSTDPARCTAALPRLGRARRRVEGPCARRDPRCAGPGDRRGRGALRRAPVGPRAPRSPHGRRGGDCSRWRGRAGAVRVVAWVA
uniref:Uncharacterized protein n=1 Tax=Janibacter limosus TaxID=53458 RepID=A0AC61U1E3_9MICO|nr:hypothetical protein [Janibacter limosus]